jgi:uncharacterized repeat protein (TIGR03843 family)
LYRKDLPGLRNLALFDVVVNNTDRKIGHLLPTPEGHIYGCDHGVTFHSEDKLRTVLWQWEQTGLLDCEINTLSLLETELNGETGEKIKQLITGEEFSALKLRISGLQKRKVFPSPSPDWPAVPWPPF